jgi:hypothetical protein
MTRQAISMPSAAVTVQRAYRAYRRQFPAKPLASASSSPRIYQDDPRLAGPLGAAFGSELRRLAGMSVGARNAEISGRLARRELVLAPGMIRAAHDAARGRMAFTGGSAGAWAVRGYEEARRESPGVADLTGAELNYALVVVQAEEAPRLASRVLGHPRPRLLRPQARRKSRSPKHGGQVRELAWAGASREPVVGAPGDRFRLRRDMVRFLGFVLGGFGRYDWRMNPRRRALVVRAGGSRGRVKRWVMHSNLGVKPRALYAWLRAMYGWRERMDTSRNWAALYPRPIAVGHATLASSMRDLLRRHVFGIPRASTIGPFPGVVSRTQPRRPTVSGFRVAGLFGAESGAGSHAGVFLLVLRRATRAWVLQVALLDPLGAMTFGAGVEAEVRAGLERAAADVLGAPEPSWRERSEPAKGDGPGGSGGTVAVQVARVPVPRALGVQYANEGACGPSSLALLLSVLREMRRPELVTPTQIAVAGFRGVRDEDVMLAAQLHHNAIL